VQALTSPFIGGGGVGQFQSPQADVLPTVSGGPFEQDCVVLTEQVSSSQAFVLPDVDPGERAPLNAKLTASVFWRCWTSARTSAKVRFELSFAMTASYAKHGLRLGENYPYVFVADQ